MPKFNIGDRVKFHMEEYPEEDDTGTLCEGAYDSPIGSYWAKWDSDGGVQYAFERYLTLIESSTKQELPSSFKIDVQAYADENNVSLEQAHNEIQPWLFEHGYSLLSNYMVVNHVSLPCLYCGTEGITYGITVGFNKSIYKQIFLSRNVSVSLSVKEGETVEILGKKYRKSDVESAMKSIKEKE